MARTKAVIRTVNKTVAIPQGLAHDVDLLLWSDLEGKVPYGAWGKLVTDLLLQHMDKLKGQGKELANELEGL